jgi:hypothetical protein
MTPGTVFLMYHELEWPGRGLVQSEPGYSRYILREAMFRSQIDWLCTNGWHGLSVGEALRLSTEKPVAITFDDGCETDWIAAAPILKEAKFHATFYITAGFLNHPGYMSETQLRELSFAGFEVGCHSMTHAYLNDLGMQQLHAEIVDARSKIEDIIGRKVEHFSCPGGRYSPQAVAVARQAGYVSFATSRAHANHPATDRFCLGRVAIMRETTQSQFENICRGKNLWKIRMRDSVRTSTRKIIGNSFYDRIRTAMLGQH